MLSYISFLHQITTQQNIQKKLPRCLISLFYIKSQRQCRYAKGHGVVLYLFSTSNHNHHSAQHQHWQVVLYLFSTSNHNQYITNINKSKLSYISFLHQITTAECWRNLGYVLSYISFLHQITTHCPLSSGRGCCLISLFYIKSQPAQVDIGVAVSCLISLFYIKSQRLTVPVSNMASCLISLFYIKSQREPSEQVDRRVVLYLFSTSNHNYNRGLNLSAQLSYISFLHQITTARYQGRGCPRLSYISFLHQITTVQPHERYRHKLSYISFLHQITT